MAYQWYTTNQTERAGLRTTGTASAHHESTGVRAGLFSKPCRGASYLPGGVLRFNGANDVT